MPWWAGDYRVAASFVVIAWLGGLFIFRKLQPEKIADWRIPNYAIVLLGMFGLLGLVADSAKEAGERLITIESPRYEGALESFKDHFRSYRRYVCDRTFNKTEFSPPNFDEIVRDQKTWCAWFEKSNSQVEKLAPKSAKKFKLTDLDDFPSVENFSDLRQSSIDRYRSFDESRKVLLEAERKADTLDIKTIFSAFAPILLGAAAGLTLAKAHYVP